MRDTRQPGELGRIGRLARRMRLALGVTAAALVVAVVCVAIVVAALLPEQTVHRPGSWVPLGLALLAVVGGVLVALVARRYLDDSREPVLVPEVERSIGLRRGQLAGALELATPVRGGSVSLARLGRDRVSDALAAREDWELFPETLRLTGRRIIIAGVLFTMGIGTLVLMAARAPARTAKAAEALSRPWATAFPPPPPRIQVAPGDTAVLRGDPLGVRAVAVLRDSVALTWQAEAEPIRRRLVAVGEDGTARGEIGPIDAPITYWVEGDDGSRSAVYEVVPLDPLLVTQLTVELRYPAYLGRPAETLGAPGAALELPAGTLVRIRGHTNAPLVAAALTDSAAEGRVPFEVEGDRFSADWRPRRDGSWAWTFEPSGELPGLSPPPPFDVRVVPDLMPAVLITYPGRDTAASVDLRLPLVVDARDDIGLDVVDLETWRVSAAGLRSEPRAVPLWEAGGVSERVDRLVLRPVLRLDALDLVPGDTLFYTARAGDANPGHGAARSDTFKVYVPTMSELRRSAAETASELARSGRELQEDAADLARAARDAERRASGRESSASERAQDEADFGATEEARRVLERGEDLDERVAEMRRELEEMREGAEDSGMSDAAMREKMAELDELFRQIEETGLGERLRQLEEALRNLDQPRAQQELGELSNTLRELESRLERTLSLMERVATEQSMKEAVEAAQQLAERQSSLAESFDDTDEWADAEAAASDDAERLAEQMQELRERLEQQGLDAASDSVGQGMQAASEAAGAMREASEAARSGEPQSGGQQQGGQQQGGQQQAAQAAGKMSEAAESMQQAGQMLNEDWKQEALEAIERATGEALDLAGEQGALADELAEGAMDPADLSGRQAALVQGLDQLLESLSEAGRKTALIDETVGRSASQARQRMQDLGESLSSGEGAPRTASAEGRALVETLNDLAGRLMASRQQVENAGSATGMEELLDQLAQMSQSQAGLNRESGGLMLMQQGGQPMAAQIRRLAERQEEIARQLEELAQRPEAQELPARPDQLSAEAGDIASELRGGTLDRQTLERQERLFRRLLDAGRSLERDEDPTRRESQAADMSRPGAVPESAGDIEAGPRYPYPTDAALSGVSNAARRLILDYFDRLNTAAGRSEGSAP